MKNQFEQSHVLLFAGQGNPVIGMGADLWGLNTLTRNIWDCASDITGMDVRRLCQKGPMNRLVKTTVQQIAVTAINVTLYTLCTKKLEKESVVGSCGHSVGEYSALYAAGAISMEDLFRIIHVRSNIMNNLSQIYKGAMLAVKGTDYQSMFRLISDSMLSLDICCDNSQFQQVIGGELADVNEFSRVLIGSGFEVVKLGVSGAWHTHLMAEGVQLMRDFLQQVYIGQPGYPVFMNVTGQEEFNPQKIKENLSLHLTNTVRWTTSMTSFLQPSAPVMFFEISNKAYLGQLLKDFDNFRTENVTHCRKWVEC
ncbi:ACP S-malonyltransferase [Klebsiella sp. RHBSTW-00484]|uniref:ACP S-malonyltransferase n=1 Tax=unclassified Klebsiella TaxID=2608929 RepID=UPI0015E4F2F3|nr:MULTISPECIES: ACP S-malonyltransferase [unclassified Klebsiella]MBA7845716.1 ACP S-malonyltransferase [Klebsiella sp. RHBSTW-00465]QLO38344.1 ACP S-malonyltransferase [Klebsiella sp. RHBSTW-00484]QLT77864.1 ACP S-malonyltransferase [Klebsiella sp. RHBSTW-00464]